MHAANASTTPARRSARLGPATAGLLLAPLLLALAAALPAAATQADAPTAVIEVRQGDTVRLRLHNRGKEMHEFVLGTTTEIEAQASGIIHPTGEEGAVYKVGDLIGTIEE
mgnify:CR=1 FL=1